MFIFKHFTLAINFSFFNKTYYKMSNSNNTYNLLTFSIKKKSSSLIVFKSTLSSLYFNQFASQEL